MQYRAVGGFNNGGRTPLASGVSHSPRGLVMRKSTIEKTVRAISAGCMGGDLFSRQKRQKKPYTFQNL